MVIFCGYLPGQMLYRLYHIRYVVKYIIDALVAMDECVKNLKYVHGKLFTVNVYVFLTSSAPI